MNIDLMDLSNLSGLEILGILLFMIVFAVLSNLKAVIDLVKSWFNKEDESEEDEPTSVGEPTILERRMWELDKCLFKCMNIMIENLPESFTATNTRHFEMIAKQAFLVECKDYMRNLVIRNHFDIMSELEFENYCKTEPIGAIRSVTRAISNMYHDADFPITREKLIEANQDLVPECISVIIGFFKKCRAMVGE